MTENRPKKPNQWVQHNFQSIFFSKFYSRCFRRAKIHMRNHKILNEKLLNPIVSERNKQFCEFLIKIICVFFSFQIELNGLATYMEASGSSSIDRFGPEMKTEDPTSISRSSGKMTTRFDFLPANTNFRSVHVFKFYPDFLLKKSQV